MKSKVKTTHFLFFAATALSVTAGADTNCVDPTTVDNAYTVVISADRTSASVRKITMAGATEVTALSCARIDTDPLTTAPGSDTLACREPDMVDHGFSVKAKAMDCEGRVNARLEEVTFAGPRTIAELVCTESP